MKKNKRPIYIGLVTLLGCLSWLCISTSCNQNTETKRIISMTIEPQRYFATLIGGDRFEYVCMVPGGQSPETYDPTPQDLIKAGKSMAYFRIGPIGFEMMWMEAIQSNQPNMKVFDLSEGMPFITETAHAHEHEEHAHTEKHEETHAHHHHHPGGIDPHIWSSFEGARTICSNMLKAFIELDPDGEEFYRANYQEAIQTIDDTQAIAKQHLSESSTHAFVIYHPSLTYLAIEMGLTQLIIEKDGKEPSPMQLKELITEAKERQVRVVFIQQEFDQKNAELIAKELDCPLVPINPLTYDWKEEMLDIIKALSGHE